MYESVIKLEGLPENVQHIADIIDDALPGKFVWVQSGEDASVVTIKIEGFEMPSMPAQIFGELAA